MNDTDMLQRKRNLNGIHKCRQVLEAVRAKVDAFTADQPDECEGCGRAQAR